MQKRKLGNIKVSEKGIDTNAYSLEKYQIKNIT